MNNRPSRDDVLTDQAEIRRTVVTARVDADPEMRCGVCQKPLTANQLGHGARYCNEVHRQQASRDRRGGAS